MILDEEHTYPVNTLNSDLSRLQVYYTYFWRVGLFIGIGMMILLTPINNGVKSIVLGLIYIGLTHLIFYMTLLNKMTVFRAQFIWWYFILLVICYVIAILAITYIFTICWAPVLLIFLDLSKIHLTPWMRLGISEILFGLYWWTCAKFAYRIHPRPIQEYYKNK